MAKKRKSGRAGRGGGSSKGLSPVAIVGIAAGAGLVAYLLFKPRTASAAAPPVGGALAGLGAGASGGGAGGGSGGSGGVLTSNQRDPNVTALQALLNTGGAGLRVDGRWGTDTRAALLRSDLGTAAQRQALAANPTSAAVGAFVQGLSRNTAGGGGGGGDWLDSAWNAIG